MEKLLVVDGNSILNRQFFGSRPLSTKSGIPTNAVIGFVKALLSQIDSYKPDYMVVAFDLKAPTFRHIQYKEYKAGRHTPAPELIAQFPYAKKFVTALGALEVEFAGYEADDIIGTFASMAEKNNCECRILTGDRDSLQLISDTTHVLLATNSEYKLMDREAFREKYTVEPEQFIDVKALMGDSSDNIPGVMGIGEKGAVKLIYDNHDLESVYEWAEKEAESGKKLSSILTKLLAGKENAYLSRFLATIVRDAPINLTLEDARLKPFLTNELISLCTELEFSSIISKLSLEKCENEEKSETKAVNVDISEFINAAYSSPAAICFENEKAYICDGRLSYFTNGAIEDVKGIFERDISFIVYDVKTLLHRLSELFIDVSKVKFEYDLILAAYVLDPSETSYTKERLMSAYLKAIQKENDSGEVLYSLYNVTMEKLIEENMYSLYTDIEYPLAFTLFNMEKEGIKVERSTLMDFSAYLDRETIECAEKIYEIAGKTFNISSPKQLGEILFEKLKLPAPKKTKTGYSTSAEVLERLIPESPIIEQILKYRQVTKLKSTYVEGLLRAMDKDSRVHTTFTQSVTATGRLSSVEPNLQNIPVRTPLGRNMRKCFTAKDGYMLIDADYSQIELRILAAISGDEIMIKAFKDGIDIHTVTASQVFGTEIDDVTPEMRKRAKAVNFGIVYGIGEYSLAGDLQIPLAKAAEYIKSYKEKYKGVAYYLKSAVENAEKTGYVTTLLGRRRYIPDLTSPKAPVRAFGQRVAMNSPIQGTAADIIKIAMLKVEKALKNSGIDAKLIMQIHDELIIEAKECDAERAKEILQNEMENALLLEVPLTVEANIGKTWYECK